MIRRYLYLVIGLLLLAVALVSVSVGWRPFIGPRARDLTGRSFEATADRLERGSYLDRNVAGCLACHSDVDTGRGVPSESAMDGAGKVMAAEGMPWLVAPNLTPDAETGVGTWSDDTVGRAIREGIGHDGRALFPMMPYQVYRAMSDEDLASVVVFLRSLPPVRRALPATEVPFPPGPLINTVPEPIHESVPPPELGDPVQRGAYLVALGGCTDCHTPMNDRGERIAGVGFAGGFVLQDSAGQVASSNLTPDPSEIPYYTEELFVDVMRTGRVISRQLNDIMPWWVYQRMSDEDLRAIFAYLVTLPPVSHRVDNTLDPTPCGICGLEHGAGQDNAPAS